MSVGETPFDAAAAGYDADFGAQPLGGMLRRAVWREIERAAPRAARVVDLGCGTGEDALHLAGAGARVVAIDSSVEMLAIAATKAGRAGLAERVRCARLDLAEIDPADDELVALGGGTTFDLALADFGPLNCLADRRPLAAALWRALAPGGRFVAVMMGRVCLWEIAWHLAHGEPARAFRRWPRRASARAVAGAAGRPGSPLLVEYPSPRALARELAPWFRLRRLTAAGALLPPPYLGHLARRAPRLLERLARLENRVGTWPPLPYFADHYVATFERRDRIADPGADRLATPPAPPLRRRVRSLGRRLRWWRFLAWDRRRLGRATVIRVAGRPLAIAAGVFDPILFRTVGTLEAALDALGACPGARVLDLGTGSGVGALLAVSRWPEAHATAVDVDPRAVACAASNARAWGVADRLEVREGDLFEAVDGERFDRVLFHPPFWPENGAPAPWLEPMRRAFYAPADLPVRFASGLAAHLAPGGLGLLLLSSEGMAAAYLSACRSAGFGVAPLVRRDLEGEILTAYRLRPRAAAPGSGAPA